MCFCAKEVERRLVEERPVRIMKISHDIIKKFGYTPGCAKCRKLSRNEYSHPGLARSQDCRTRMEAASRRDLMNRGRAERAEQRKMENYVKEVELGTECYAGTTN